jgi:hypothetical protein
VFQLIRTLSTQDLVRRQIPAFSISFVIASLFYRFGSFALECVAFLVTWAVLDMVAGLLIRTAAPLRRHRPT